MFHIGVVEDRKDPRSMGRVRVRVMGLHSENKNEVPTDTLPWATVMTPTTSPSVSGLGHTPFLVTGSWVVVMFNDKQFQDPIVLGTIPGRPDEKRSPSVGFSDPLGVYPKWTGETDISYSARSGRYEDSESFLKKTDLWDEGPDIQTALPPKVTTVAKDKDDSYYEAAPWNELPVSNDHRPVYPMNHVFESEAGHLEEYDDTPGNKRYHRYHPAGSFEEIYDDGTRNIKIVGTDYEMVLQGKNMYINGNLNVTVTGDMRQLVYGNYHLEVEKEYTVNVKGSKQQKIGGNFETEVFKHRATNVGGNDNLTVMLDSVQTVMQGKTTTVEGDYENTITGNYDVTTFSKMTMFSALGTDETTLGPLNVTASGDISMESPSDMSIQIEGDIDADANRIDLN